MQVVSQEAVLKAITNQFQNQSCTDFHLGMSCNQKAFSQFLLGTKSIYKMYLVVHLLPFLLFKRKHLKRNPRGQLLKLLLGFVKSLLFAGGYSALVRRTVCFICQHHKFAGYSNGIAAIVSSVTLTFQPVSRQSQIAMYTLNKSMEVCYNMLKRRGAPLPIPGGQGILLAMAMSFICYHYINHPDAIRGSYLKIMDKLLANC